MRSAGLFPGPRFSFQGAAVGEKSDKKNSPCPHPQTPRAASHSQRNKKRLREIEMTKLASITAAFVLFAPVAFAIFAQAAQIVA